jgi:Domain of unknown function (DUF397)
MDTLDPQWRKSSRSGGNGGACVEVGQHCGGVLVRDSKLESSSLELPFSSGAWADFLVTLR